MGLRAPLALPGAAGLVRRGSPREALDESNPIKPRGEVRNFLLHEMVSGGSQAKFTPTRPQLESPLFFSGDSPGGFASVALPGTVR